MPQGVGPAALRGGGPARHGRAGVRPDDHLPQQGADGREPDAAGGQPPQRRHRPAAKMRPGPREELLPLLLPDTVTRRSPSPSLPAREELTDLRMDF